ncbi:MAG: type IV toxin-antitoxin system AbiEi family antitoxin [Ignavibacteriales bacterium]|nr:type IV toxin-antitoxin system AbiEi family antitoxin [Ignavibacteriales bacterium]
MSKSELHITLRNWIEKLQAHGRNSFSLKEIHRELPDLSDVAVMRSLNRLSAKGKILSILRGYYLIIPPQYSSKGVLPPVLFIDALMKHLGRKYYVGLLSAAAFHGASHQQPQEFFVFTGFPVMIATIRNGLTINYISKSNIPEELLQERKTESGYVKISSPILTALDLIQFQSRIGGLNRAASVINELMESIKPSDFTNNIFIELPVTAMQRLGYLLERVLNNKGLADELFEAVMRSGYHFQRIPLNTKKVSSGCVQDDRWKILINSEIEVD